MQELKSCPLTHQEAIDQLKELLDHHKCTADSDPDEEMWQNDVQALTYAISILSQGNRPDNWISVDHSLPTVNERYGEIDVLVHLDDGFIATATYVKHEGFELWADSGEVTHWMYLPETPKGM